MKNNEKQESFLRLLAEGIIAISMIAIMSWILLSLPG
jgi:hypothetical protein